MTYEDFNLVGMITAKIKALEDDVDRLHDECNKRAKDQETVEQTLRKALDLPEDDILHDVQCAFIAQMVMVHQDLVIGKLKVEVESFKNRIADIKWDRDFWRFVGIVLMLSSLIDLATRIW